MRARIQSKVAAAFNRQLADAVTTFTGRREIPPEYDPETGEITGGTLEYQGRGVMGGYSVEEVDQQHILATDVKLTALQNEITHEGAAFEPAVDDEIAGYKVVRAQEDPASASWALQLRRT